MPTSPSALLAGGGTDTLSDSHRKGGSSGSDQFTTALLPAPVVADMLPSQPVAQHVRGLSLMSTVTKSVAKVAMLGGMRPVRALVLRSRKVRRLASLRRRAGQGRT